MRARMLLVITLAAAAGCGIDASFEGTRYRCDQSGACPAGFACVAQVCEPAVDGGEGDAGAGPWQPTAACGGLGALRDDLTDGVDGWGAAFPATDAMVFGDGALRASISPAASDVRVGYRSRYAYATAGDALAVTIHSLAGPGRAGLALSVPGHTLELTVGEDTVRCARFAGGAVVADTVDREGADELRVSQRTIDGVARLVCEARKREGAEPDPDQGWRPVGTPKDALPDALAQVELIVTGNAGQDATSAAFAAVNPARTASAWCGPGELGDPLDGLGRWQITATDCTVTATAGDAVIGEMAAATFHCVAEYRQPVRFASGTIGFELGAVTPGATGTRRFGLARPDRSARVLFDLNGTDLTAYTCVRPTGMPEACTPLLAMPAALPAGATWLGFVRGASGLRLVASTDARTWTTIHTLAAPPLDASAALVQFAAFGPSTETVPVEYRVRQLATQP